MKFLRNLIDYSKTPRNAESFPLHQSRSLYCKCPCDPHKAPPEKSPRGPARVAESRRPGSAAVRAGRGGSWSEAGGKVRAPGPGAKFKICGPARVTRRGRRAAARAWPNSRDLGPFAKDARAPGGAPARAAPPRRRRRRTSAAPFH